jgi:hypothetical protein
MKATKYAITITVECLSTDCVTALVQWDLAEYNQEVCNGILPHDDGDEVSWDTHSNQVII